MGLSAIAADFPEIAEIDINPLIATAIRGPQGGGRPDHPGQDRKPATAIAEPVPPPAIHSLFYPARWHLSAHPPKWANGGTC
jgi:hypothetical protein